MVNIFVILSFIFLIHEMNTLFFTKKYDQKISKIKKNLNNSYLNPNDRPFMTFQLVYFIWSIFGLFTLYRWIIALFITFSMISSLWTKTDDTIKRIRLRRLDSIISIVFLITIIVKHFI